MGYSTEFKGSLKFKEPLTAEQELYIQQFLNYEEPREHPDWIIPDKNKTSYQQLELTADKTGIQWDGNEKFYHAVEAVNIVILNMQAKFPDFGLTGKLLAQGEEVGDVWFLKIIDGKAVEVPIDLE